MMAMDDRTLVGMAVRDVLDPVAGREQFDEASQYVTSETAQLAHSLVGWESDGGPAVDVMGSKYVRAEALQLIDQARATNEGTPLAPTVTSRMSGIEFRARREALGLERTDVATVFGNLPDTIKFWERGRTNVPYCVRHEMAMIEADTAEHVAELASLADQAENDGGHGSSWWVSVIERAQPAIRAYGLRWWRTCCVRAWGAREIPAAVMTLPASWAPIE